MSDIKAATTEAIVGVQYSHNAPQDERKSPSKVHPKSWKWGSGKVNAGYDSSSTNLGNMRHWSFTTNNSADASMRPEIRKKIRQRARYEVLENNPIGLGIVLTLANDTIGTGPRLHMGLKNEKYNHAIQQAWFEWSHAIGLTDKLHTMKMAKTIDGEAVARIVTNPKINMPVTLDLRPLECDRLEAPFSMSDLRPDYIDGVHLDSYDNPIAYDILKHHPGADYYHASSLEYDTYDAHNIIHWYRTDRAEQHRGMSECQSALELFALLRRFTLATCSAAETAANLSLVLHTDSPVSDEYEEEQAALMNDFLMDSVSLDRNAATVLPNGWDIRQINAAHPTTTYAMFKHELIAEIARCLSMPYNIAAANSAEHNYASGRLDHQTYHHAITVERDRLDRLVMDRLFVNWLTEAGYTNGVLPKNVARKVREVLQQYGPGHLARVFKHRWHWDGFAHSDPVKEAQAQQLRIKTGVSHRALEYAKEGRDIDVEDAVAAETAGLSLTEYRNALAVQNYFNGNGLQGTVTGVIDRETTSEISKGEDTALSNEPPQLREAREMKKRTEQAEDSTQAAIKKVVDNFDLDDDDKAELLYDLFASLKNNEKVADKADSLIASAKKPNEDLVSSCDECDCEECHGSVEDVVAATLPKGRKLNKPFRTPGKNKKFAVYTKNEKGNVVIVRFGDPNMDIKRDDPNRRKNFRARHGCDKPGVKKWTPKYWSCRMWAKGQTVSDLA